MSIRAKYRVACDSRGGLCLSQTKPHGAPDPAIYEALEAGWWLDDDGDWHCPLCGIKQPDPTELLNCALGVGLGEMTGEEIKAELHELGTSSEEVYSKFLEFVRLGIVARNRGRIEDARAERQAVKKPSVKGCSHERPHRGATGTDDDTIEAGTLLGSVAGR